MASSMNIMGTYSGITMETVDQLIQAESGKGVKFSNDQEKLRTEQAAWKDIQTRLTNLSEKLSGLMKPETFNSKKMSLSQEGKFKLTASPEALSSDYTISVTNLATRTQVTGESFTQKGLKLGDALNESGELVLTIPKKMADGTIENKTTVVAITATDSIENIVDRINEGSKDSGVSAAIIDNRLVLQSQEFGERQLSVTGDLADKLGLAQATTQLGQNAELTVNGIKIVRDSNHLTDITKGVTIDLIATTTDPVRVSLTQDLDSTAKAVQDFVDQYNSTLAFIGEQLDVGDPSLANNKTGSLTGDSSLVRLQSQLRTALTQPLQNGHKELNSAKSIGIEIDRYGVATLDTSKLKEALREDSQAVAHIFKFDKVTSTTQEDGTIFKKKEEIGLAQKVNHLLNSFTDSKAGVIATKNESYDKLIKDLGQRIEKFNERIEVKRQQYIEKFTALDIAMMEAESQLNYLMSQIGGTKPNQN
ncbi:flagellar filament capping protein FliD [Jeotgalibaca dankookensis]|uniref:flagellar filament capping protein FliD n=1 Tax=Jeotgalibaca dankookensis TaxID=708126 RepID=UPI0007860E30|nr:flagellar filament capping protein FliD [Jeotgalibaca dankookensis]